MEIRRIKPEDIKELIKAQYKSEADYDPGIKFSEEGLKAIMNWMNKKLSSGGALLLAAYEEKPIGYVFAYIEYKNRKIWRYDLGKISDIYVLPEHRRKGIGKLLMKKAIDWFRKRRIKDIMLEVAFENKIAIKFYEKLGFKKSSLIMRFVE